MGGWKLELEVGDWRSEVRVRVRVVRVRVRVKVRVRPPLYNGRISFDNSCDIVVPALGQKSEGIHVFRTTTKNIKKINK